MEMSKVVKEMRRVKRQRTLRASCVWTEYEIRARWICSIQLSNTMAKEWTVDRWSNKRPRPCS